MKRLLIILLFLGGLYMPAGARESVRLTDVARRVAQRAQRYIDIEDYKGSVFLQGMAEMALVSRDDWFTDETHRLLKRFVEGQLTGYGSFISYRRGGTALAEMACFGAGEYRQTALETAERMWLEQPRNQDGIMMPPWEEIDGKNPVFADIVLAVVPYMLYCGLTGDNPEYVDDAARLAVEVYEDLYDESTGLIHQVRGCRNIPKDATSEDCWSRGNGWLSMAFAALLRDLPESHPRYKEVRRTAGGFFAAVLKFQDDKGLWHQEMTYPDSYVEISGSALLLCGIGAALEAGLLPGQCRQAFLNGMQGMMAYIDREGNVGNTCSGCLAYKSGSKEDYASHPYFCNEAHAFGPVLLACAQSLRLGVDRIDLATEPGSAIRDRIPECRVRFVAERKGDIAWENDRIALRIYSQEVKEKVSSGVDFWTKSVDYPVIDRWYALNDRGEDYHTDRGEGYDFYAVGRNRGIGGTGIWDQGRLYIAEPYATHRILRDTPGEIAFEVAYPPYEAGDEVIRETKRIRMVLGTYFFQVTSTVTTESGRDAVLAIGLTDFGHADVGTDPDRGLLCLQERISEADGSIGCAVIADPSRTAGFATAGKDRLLLLKLRSGEPVTYYVGAGWSRDLRFDPFASKWPRMLKKLDFEKLNLLYSGH